MTALPPSQRGSHNVRSNLMIDLSRRIESDRYDAKSNPNGIIDLGSAVNTVMDDDLGSWLKHNINGTDITASLSFNDPQGSPELPKAVASFMNKHFRCRVLLSPDNILIANGVTSLLDSIAFNVADQGDAIIIPTPTYGMFNHDLATRNGIRIVHVPFDDIPYSRFEPTNPCCGNWPDLCPLVSRIREVLLQLVREGTRVAAILLANPENPLGRCYTPTVIKQLSQLCVESALHLIVDEIYALSVGNRFESVLSLDFIDNFKNVHVLWGMSKDFGMSGVRLGFVATYNRDLYATMRTLSMFNWATSFSATVTTKLLMDVKYTMNYFIPVLRRRLQERRSYLEEELKECEVPFVQPQAGLFIFVDLSNWIDYFDGSSCVKRELQLAEYMIGHGVFLEPGQAFFSLCPGWYRLNFAGVESTLKLGLRRLFGALQALEEQEKPRIARKSMREKKHLGRGILKFSCF